MNIVKLDYWEIIGTDYNIDQNPNWPIDLSYPITYQEQKIPTKKNEYQFTFDKCVGVKNSSLPSTHTNQNK